MKDNRRDRRAIGKALRKAMKTGNGSCVMVNGTQVVFVRQICPNCNGEGVWCHWSEPGKREYRCSPVPLPGNRNAVNHPELECLLTTNQA